MKREGGYYCRLSKEAQLSEKQCWSRDLHGRGNELSGSWLKRSSGIRKSKQRYRSKLGAFKNSKGTKATE